MQERTRTYATAMALNRPVARWGRLEVSGVDSLPETGPLLIVDVDKLDFTERDEDFADVVRRIDAQIFGLF